MANTRLFYSPLSAALFIDMYNLQTGKFTVFGLHYHFQEVKLEPNVWYSFCIAYNTATNLVTLWLNGKQILEEKNKKESPPFKVLFQEIYLGGDSVSPFVGKMTDFNIWSKTLADKEINDFSNCNLVDDSLTPIPFKWGPQTKLNLTRKGTKLFNTTRSKICSDHESSKIKLFAINL